MNRPLEMLIIDDNKEYAESLYRKAQRFQILLKHRDNLEDAKLFLKSDEEKMLNACIQGSKEAWDTFVEKYTKLIYYVINKTL